MYMSILTPFTTRHKIFRMFDETTLILFLCSDHVLVMLIELNGCYIEHLTQHDDGQPIACLYGRPKT